jgi:hypothetical protein
MVGRRRYLIFDRGFATTCRQRRKLDQPVNAPHNGPQLGMPVGEEE